MKMDDRVLFRHLVATLAYRAAKPLRGAPDGFATFKASESSRTPVQILAHMGDLADWALALASGREGWRESAPLAWPEETARFFAALERFDAFLASSATLVSPLDRLLQGPIADALTHVGQLTMLRRQYGAPIRAENYHRADIVVGRVGIDQTPPAREFQ
jgi:hypothetical protein